MYAQKSLVAESFQEYMQLPLFERILWGDCRASIRLIEESGYSAWSVAVNQKGHIGWQPQEGRKNSLA